jgi:hypothetical protein
MNIFSENVINLFFETLVQKFIELNQEFGYKYDDIIAPNLRNDKMINYIRLFKNNGFTYYLIVELIGAKRVILDYLVQNNYYLYKFHFRILDALDGLYNNSKEVFKEIFTKFTIKQQNNLRMKQLMGDEGYEELTNRINMIFNK